MTKPLNILIVEDCNNDAILLVEELRKAGFETNWRRVETAADYVSALNPKLDLIFSDFALPEFSIERGLQLLRDSKLKVPFIIVSGSIGEERAVESLRAGATDYLLKDHLSRLGPAVRRALSEARELIERKQAEEALSESERRFRQLAENIREVFWMTNPDKSQMLYLSPAYETIWGRSCEGVYRNPKAWLEAIHSEDRDRVLQAALTKQATGEYDETYRILRPDGSIRWIRDRAYPIRDEKGRIYRLAGTAEDITGQRQLESQLRQAQKMEAIGTLAGGIAHDFNNILGAIIGYTDLAKLQAENDPALCESLNEVSKAGFRARDLVQQILTFSRQREQERIPVQLRHVINEALKLLRAATPATIRFGMDLARDAPMVMADATQIHQIVMNLATNAVHAMRGGPGALETRLERVVVDGEMAAANASLKAGTYARLTMIDTGHGMDQSTLPRIFEPFFTTKAPGEGTGLGLSVVHGIVQSYGGWIDVSSELGKGAQFRLYFPAIEEVETDAGRGKEEAPHGAGEQILFIDDEEALMNLGKRMLEKLGYVVTAMTDPATAFDRIVAEPERFALVITDFTMPGMTGLELARKIRQFRRELPVVLSTGNAMVVSSDDATDAGIRDVLMKPFSIASIANKVQSVLAAN